MIRYFSINLDFEKGCPSRTTKPLVNVKFARGFSFVVMSLLVFQVVILISLVV